MATRAKETSAWPVGHIVVTKRNLIPFIFYLRSEIPNLLLLVDCSAQQEPFITILGASANKESLSIGSTAFPMQTIRSASSLNYADQFIAEHRHGSWCMHCGPYIGQQGGCLTCFLQRLRVIDFCPWHQDDDPEFYCSHHQGLHLVGRLESVDEVNFVGYIDECFAFMWFLAWKCKNFVQEFVP